MIIGIIADPLSHPDWPQIEAFLDPSAKYGGTEILPEGHALWAVYDGLQLVGCATARLTVDDFGEVVLVGGRNAAKWIKALDAMIGNWMRDEGMKTMRAYGRKGWGRLSGWELLGQQGKFYGYERQL